MKRFAITHLAKDGLRTLAFANQGRNHYDTREAAEKALEAYRPDLQSKLGLVALEVREIECFSHGDAVGIYVDTDFQPVNGMPPFTATCCACGQTFTAANVVRPHQPEAVPTMYADTTGTPWKAYYCEPCSAPARRLQEVSNGTN